MPWCTQILVNPIVKAYHWAAGNWNLGSLGRRLWPWYMCGCRLQTYETCKSAFCALSKLLGAVERGLTESSSTSELPAIQNSGVRVPWPLSNPGMPVLVVLVQLSFSPGPYLAFWLDHRTRLRSELLTRQCICCHTFEPSIQWPASAGVCRAVDRFAVRQYSIILCHGDRGQCDPKQL